MIFNSGVSHTHDYLPLSGGTLTGDLAMDDCDIDVEGGYAMLLHPEIVRGTAPASDIYGSGGALKLCDKNGMQIGFIQSMQLTNGTEAMQLGVGNSDSSDWNTLAIGWNGNGNKYVNVSGQTEWRNAIGAAAASHTHDYLPLSGGTATGNINVQSSSIDRDGTDPSSVVNGNSLVLLDKDDEGIGIIRPTRQTDGRQDVYIIARNENNSGDQVENVLRIGVDKTGDGNIETTGRIKADGSVGFSYSEGNRCTLNRSGDYLYITASDANGNGIGAYRFNMTEWGLVYRPWTNGAWGSWESHIWNSATSRTANTVLAAPNGSNGAATFRTLVPDDCSWLGDRKADDQSSNVSVANTTWVAIASVTLGPGLWVLNGNVTFASNATGRRCACIHSASPTTAAQRQCGMVANAVNGAWTVLNLAGSKAPTSSTTYGLYAYQTSGSALNCTGYIAATRIK